MYGGGDEEEVTLCEAERERLACLSKGDQSGVRLAETKILANLMQSQFGNATIDETLGTVTVHVLPSFISHFSHSFSRSAKMTSSLMAFKEKSKAGAMPSGLASNEA